VKHDVTAETPLPSSSSAASSPMNVFLQVMIADFFADIHHLPDKNKTVDPLSIHLLEAIAVEIAPFLVALCIKSLSCGLSSDIFKIAHLPLQLTKWILMRQTSSYTSFFQSLCDLNLLEQFMVQQLVDYLPSAGVILRLQAV
jgi:hypothetical protein